MVNEVDKLGTNDLTTTVGGTITECLNAACGMSIPEYIPLDKLLDNMIKYGRPRLSLLDNGWYCKVEIYSIATGFTSEIASDFKNPTSHSAALQCYNRLLDMVNGMQKLINGELRG